MSKTLILSLIRDLRESAYNTIIQGGASFTSQKIKIAKINRMLKININLMATNGGYYPLRKENIRGYFISVGTFTHHEKTGEIEA